MTFDARVNSVLESDFPGQLSLELRVQETFLRANIDVKAIGEAAWEKAQRLTPESIVRVAGHIHLLGEKAQANGDGIPTNGHQDASSDVVHGVHVVNLAVIAQASPNLPSFHRDELSKLGLEERLNNRVLDVRNAATGAIFKLHSGMCQLMVEFLCSNGFHWIHTPRIVSATIAGDNEFFHLPYFGRDAWLAQSSQHHKQMALSMDMQRVFEIGPVFRAEIKSRASARHMTEVDTLSSCSIYLSAALRYFWRLPLTHNLLQFTVLDIGMAIQEDYHEVVEMIESMLVFVFRGLQERKQYRHLTEVVERLYPSAKQFRIGLDEHGKVPRITFTEARRILREELGFEADDKKDFR